jgi:5,10-methylene-tetrahydrofolate dehydrogenase/methenyl tetrahydrofolate cyclohydrolase
MRCHWLALRMHMLPFVAFTAACCCNGCSLTTQNNLGKVAPIVSASTGVSCSQLLQLLLQYSVKLQNIKGKVALIVGASTGLGRGVADRLAQAGMTVIGTSRNPQEYTNGRDCTYTKPGDRCKPGV